MSLLERLAQWATFYGLSILAAILILIVGYILAKAIKGLVGRVLEKRGTDDTITTFVSHLAYIALITFAVIAALSRIGIQTTSFIAVLGAAGLGDIGVMDPPGRATALLSTTGACGLNQGRVARSETHSEKARQRSPESPLRSGFPCS